MPRRPGLAPRAATRRPARSCARSAPTALAVSCRCAAATQLVTSRTTSASRSSPPTSHSSSPAVARDARAVAAEAEWQQCAKELEAQLQSQVAAMRALLEEQEAQPQESKEVLEMGAGLFLCTTLII